MSYNLSFKPALAKDLRSLPKSMIIRIFKRIIDLQADPFPPQSTKLVGMNHSYRVRVGDYRIIYEVDEARNLITVQYVRHRRDAYQNL